MLISPAALANRSSDSITVRRTGDSGLARHCQGWRRAV